MRGSNLDINIAVNSDKARADLELLKAQFRATTKEIKALSNEAAKTGDRTKLDAAIPAARAMEAQLKSLNRTFAQTGEVAQVTGNNIAISTRSFRSLEQAVFGLGKTFGGAKVGIAAFAAAFAVKEIAGAIQNNVDKINGLNKAASNLSLPVATVKAFQDQLAKQGLTTEQTNSALSKLSQSFFDTQLKAGTFNNVLTSGVNVLRGSERSINGVAQGVTTMRGAFTDGANAATKFVEVFRGGQPVKPVTDLTDAVERFLKVSPAAFKPGDVEGYIRAVAQALSTTKNLTDQLRSQIGQQVFGPDWQKAVAGILAGIDTGDLDKAKAKANQIITPEAQKAVEDYNRAWGELNTTITDVATNATTSSLPAITAGLDAATASVGRFAAAWEAVKSAVGTAAIAGAPVGPGGFASGGNVRGPGTGTSDSILARLSNGEFVMRARAVEHWGPRFMAALNSMQNPFGYNAGGLVRPRFADGGLVAAGGGTGRAVHLHLGGQSFALSGAGNVVDALVSHARQQQMRSSGVKPSWYGGRANS